MHMRIGLLCCICFWIQICVGQSQLPERPLSHLKDYNLKGKVKDFKIIPYQVVDSFGVIIKRKELDTWTGDDISFFDEKGYKVGSEKFNLNGKLRYKIIIRYNDKNQRITRDIYNPTGKINTKYVYVYDAKGYKTAYRAYHSNGELMESWDYVNDYRGRESEVSFTDSKIPALSQKFSYQYDKMNNISTISKLNLETNEVDELWKYAYNSQGRVTMFEFYKKGEFMYKLTVSYDANGNEDSIRKYNQKGEFIEEREYAYTFDENGNWIQRIEYVNLFPKAVYERTINYY